MLPIRAKWLLAGALLLAGGALGATEESAATPPSSLTDDQSAVIREILQGAPITSALHARFWQPLRAAGLSREQLAQFGDALASRGAWVSTQAYQRDVWEAARRSYDERKVVRTTPLDAMEASALKETASAPGGPAELQQHIEVNASLLQAAASRTPLHLPSGESIQITPELIDSMIADIDRAYARMRVLLDPTSPEAERHDVRMVFQMPAEGAAGAAMANATAETFRLRLHELRVEGSVEVAAGNRVEARLSRVTDPERAGRVLEARGTLALRLIRYPDTSTGVATRQELLEHFGGRLPDDLEVVSGPQRNALGATTGEVYYAAERRALATERDLAEVHPGRTDENEIVLEIQLQPAAAASLSDATGHNGGGILAVVVDERVVTAPKLEGRIGEYAAMRGLTIRQAEELSAILTGGSLPAGIKVVEEHVGETD